MNKFLLLKGRAGLGNRILCLLGSILYAQLTSRKLIVDWSDPTYSDDGSNIFSKLFTIDNVEQTTDIPDTNSIFPSIWKGNLDLSITQIFQKYKILDDDNFIATPFRQFKSKINVSRLDYDEDLLIIWSYFADIHKMRRFFQNDFAYLTTLNEKTILKKISSKHLHLNQDIQYRIDVFKKKYFTNTPLVIGLHIRHTDRKNPFQSYVEIINKIIQQNSEYLIFLATDNKQVQTHFKNIYKERIIYTEKWFPDETASLSRLHHNSDCPNKLENAIQALVDLYLLASCNYLLCDQRSTFPIVAEVISDIPSTNIIDISKYSMKRNMRRLICFLESQIF
ncbi:hypothetical protein NIES4103_06680 [Nostoc sp. NIES-4103]|nr:hypothetical protein NIES4103_06680 [Nostoc sp. NIES-4103]